MGVIGIVFVFGGATAERERERKLRCKSTSTWQLKQLHLIISKIGPVTCVWGCSHKNTSLFFFIIWITLVYQYVTAADWFFDGYFNFRIIIVFAVKSYIIHRSIHKSQVTRIRVTLHFYNPNFIVVIHIVQEEHYLKLINITLCVFFLNN